MRPQPSENEYFEVGGRQVPAIAVVVLFAAAILFGSVVLSGWDPLDADVRYDWLATNEALRPGGDSYNDINELAQLHGLRIEVNADPAIKVEASHPRTPGALLLQTPLLLLPTGLLFATVSVVSFLAIGWVSAVRDTDSGISRKLTLIAVLLTAPTFVTLRFAGQAALVAVLTLGGWMLAGSKKEIRGGILIGLAATLKVFPLILLVPLLIRRQWRSAAAMLGTFAALNAAGLLLPGVSWEAAIPVFSDASTLWRGLYSNGSIHRMLDIAGLGDSLLLVVAVGVLVLGLLYLRRSGFNNPFGYLALGLLTVPLSWVSYDLILVPPVILMMSSSKRWVVAAGSGALGLWLIPVVLPWIPASSGFLSMLARIAVLLMAGLAASPFESWGMVGRSVKTIPDTPATVSADGFRD